MTLPTTQLSSSVDLKLILPGVIDVVRLAGAKLRAEFLLPDGPRGSGSHADVDEEIEWLLRSRLLALLPAFYRGEETGAQAAELGAEGWCWLVDPHDGTAAFLRGHRGSAVSVGLLRDGVPVLGVVFAPLSPDRGEDLIAWAEGCGAITRNGAEIPELRNGNALQAGDVVFLSQDAPRYPGPNASLCSPARFVAMPSIAYRLARVAVGDGVAAVSLSGPQGHDYAAGHALLRATGRVLVNEFGDLVTYGVTGLSDTERCFGGVSAAVKQLAKRNWSVVLRQPGTQKPPARVVLAAPRIANDHQLDCAAGVMLGQLIGDSLGSLVEFLSPHEIEHRYPQGVRNLADGGTWGTIAGQPTDDSELALALARSLIAEGKFVPESAATAYADWIESGPFDVGHTTSVALTAAAHAPAGMRASEAMLAALIESQANGSLMRVSPMGIHAAGDPAYAAELAREDSLLTHPNAVCVESCAAFAAAVSVGVAGGDRKAMVLAAKSALAPGVAGASVASAIAAAEAGELPVAYGSKQGWVLIAIQIAFRQLLHSDSFEEALVQVVGLGGDTDTNGAIAGALLGAWYGRKAMPSRWVLPVLACRTIVGFSQNPRPPDYWPDDAVEIAEALLG